MTFNEALWILRHGSAEGEHKYLQAVQIIEDEVNAVQERNGRLQVEIAEMHKDLIAAEEYAFTLKQQNARLLKIAGAMHTWIFLHTGDEEQAYTECGLTDEDNALLGYCGRLEFETEARAMPNDLKQCKFCESKNVKLLYLSFSPFVFCEDCGGKARIVEDAEETGIKSRVDNG